MSIGFLKIFLALDGAATAILALALLFAGGPLAAQFGLPQVYLVWGGWICLGAAALLFYAATRPVPPVLAVWDVVAINLSWVVASIVVFEIEMARLTVLGQVAIIGLALVVLGAAIVQAMGARMLGRGRATTA